MSDAYIDYRFRFAVADCARVVPLLRGLPNMLGEPLDASGLPIVDLDAEEPAFYGARVGQDIIIAFRSLEEFGSDPALTAITADESASILGVWA
jgi:hypothetical protein